MTAIHHLYAAYAVTWIIHLGYIVYLTRRFARLKQRVNELRSQP